MAAGTRAAAAATVCRTIRVKRAAGRRGIAPNGEGYTGTRPRASFFAFAPQPGGTAGGANCFGV